MIMEFVTYLAITGTVFWWGLVLAPWGSWRTQEQIEADSVAVDANAVLRDITVPVPARNEAPFIKHTLQALRQQGAALRIIVIDDQSTDGTAEQARHYEAEVITGSAPAPGWSGKLWALEQGLDKVRTPYTLLLDADIELAPGILVPYTLNNLENMGNAKIVENKTKKRRHIEHTSSFFNAVIGNLCHRFSRLFSVQGTSYLTQKSTQKELALVSLMAAPPLKIVIERLLMSAFIFVFKLLYPFSLANKLSSRLAAAAGGCVLIETKALREVGAFTSIHDALIDSCTSAAQVKERA